jgi:hypothetical protein
MVAVVGGKKGVDMAGMSDLGGVKFFNLAVETPAGDIALLEKVLEGGFATDDQQPACVQSAVVIDSILLACEKRPLCTIASESGICVLSRFVAL